MMYIQRGDSALMEAVRRGKTGVVKELVERGADLNLQNKVCCFDVIYMYKIIFGIAVYSLQHCMQCWTSILYT